MKQTGLFFTIKSLTLKIGLLFLLPVALAHSGEKQPHQDSHGGNHMDDTMHPDTDTYFDLSDHAGVMYAHIAVMTIAWVIAHRVAVMLSLAKSRYTPLLQLVFFGANGFGIFLAFIYNVKTPDLYPNNAHHKIGWIITFIVVAQVLVGLVGRVAGAFGGQAKAECNREEHDLIPVAAQHDASDGYFSGGCRTSHDNSQDSGSNTETLQEHSDDDDSLPMHNLYKEYRDEDDEVEGMTMSTPTPKGRLAFKAAKVVSSRVWKPFAIGYQVIDRIILPFGFVAFATGIVTYGGHYVFGGLGHWIKGGVFVWMGLFTLGRWCGSFAEIGWAWNARPRRRGQQQAWRPSCELVESSLICFYGCTNIFLEHIGGWGGQWTGRDFEHIAITILYIGGGALGMLVESNGVRELLNTTVYNETSEYHSSSDEEKQHQRPKTYEFSLSPIPALVIFLLGIMMSSHQQSSMMASMIHKQWGQLLSGASLARSLTYVVMYLKPPTSVLPSRPPTELLTSFGLISGGIILMASSDDTITGMLHYDLDVMFMYTVTLGFVGLLMAWEVIVLALKGWAVRKERRMAHVS